MVRRRQYNIIKFQYQTEPDHTPLEVISAILQDQERRRMLCTDPELRDGQWVCWSIPSEVGISVNDLARIVASGGTRVVVPEMPLLPRARYYRRAILNLYRAAGENWPYGISPLTESGE